MNRATTFFVLLALAAFLAPDARSQEISPTTGELHYTAAAPEINGEFDEAWLTSPMYEFPFGEEGHMFGAWLTEPEHTTGPEDFSGFIRALWDEQYLYVRAEMTDDEPYAPGAPECWRNDSIEIMLDGGNEKSASYDANDAYLAFRLGGDVSVSDPDICTLSVLDRDKAIANIVYATAVTDTGWVIEVRIPWENVDVVPANGLQIGFNVYANDADGRGTIETPARDVQLSWAQYSVGNGWQNPRAHGTMTLVGGPGGSVANAAFTSNPADRVIVGEEVTFDASASTAPADIVSYEWDFGDGTTGSGVTVTHTYTQVGRYIVTLDVTDADGAQGSAERPVSAWDGIGRPETPLEIPLAATPPEIDGVMDEVWADAQRIVIATRANNTLPDGPDDLSAEAWVMWDADNLYVFFDVTDDDLQFNSTDTWQDDSVEIYVDGGYERATAYDDNDCQFEMGWSRESFTGARSACFAGASFVSLTKDGETGYTIEAALPWSSIGVEDPETGMMIGFEAMVNDDDADEGGDGRSHKLAWYAPEGVDLAYTDPSVFGSARLVEEITVSTEPASGVPVAFAIKSIYPNPFNPSTTAIITSEAAGEYEVKVYNALGQLVRVQEVRVAAPGRVQVSLNLDGEASGLYLIAVRNVGSGKVATAKAVFLK